ncbi:cobalamin-5'-phosphate synthase [Palleronia marisminoris]|uniref:Adenosylcobinamide-GDP ribazoletransferase n=1 Tax=Palleronia marisminoris TaxID=315423 RepID=A0A1Y5SJ39_9RHOB|nr:adenosylcobinamide-GDP ribazoletransferase [Palleronia marisminoris]SFG84558.1 cobalamin-5'-phosphate synthase [Palleronia marisminoris]SLN42027.1 Cobalamin synthase [Palleronia marisminoris]
MNRIIDEIRVAILFLTRLPVGRLDTPPELKDAAWAFPVAGLVPAAIGWAVFSVAGGDLLGAALAVAAMMLVTGGLHFDGLADFADGIGGGRDREHVLTIMEDSRIGSYGVLALIAIALVQVAAIAAVGHGAVFLFLGVLSRIAMLRLLTALPPAREKGLSAIAMGAPHFWRSGVLALVLALGVGWAALWAALAMALVYVAVRRLCLKRMGGQTGDACGATQLLAETAGWAALALAA